MSVTIGQSGSIRNRLDREDRSLPGMALFVVAVGEEPGAEDVVDLRSSRIFRGTPGQYSRVEPGL
jgi:hypothetical protein